MNWSPEIVKVGDVVCCPTNPKWGKGTVLAALDIGTLRLFDGEIITYHRNSSGQRVSVRFGQLACRLVADWRRWDWGVAAMKRPAAFALYNGLSLK